LLTGLLQVFQQEIDRAGISRYAHFVAARPHGGGVFGSVVVGEPAAKKINDGGIFLACGVFLKM